MFRWVHGWMDGLQTGWMELMGLILKIVLNVASNSYMSTAICSSTHTHRKEGNILFNEALNTFYLRTHTLFLLITFNIVIKLTLTGKEEHIGSSLAGNV